jgi:hypothetical protein
MPQHQSWNWIPTHLTIDQFEQFVLPHLYVGSRGPQPKLSLHAIFNYILKLLYLGCQWKELPIATNKDGQPEIHYSRIYRAFRSFEIHGCFESIFAGSVSVLTLLAKLTKEEYSRIYFANKSHQLFLFLLIVKTNIQ